MQLTVQSHDSREVIDITELIANAVGTGHRGVQIFLLHTTAAVTTADLDPGTDQDLLDALQGMLPNQQWRHPHNPDHAPDHLLSSIIGPSVVVPVKDGRLVLGTWQRIVLIELSGPRERTLEITFM